MARRASVRMYGIPAVSTCVDMGIRCHRHDYGTNGADHS